MNENDDDYSHVQRRLCAVIAKSEWTSSRMRMQKSGEELRESRAKSHRTANQFLQNLLEKRTDSDSLDDNGAVDRYHKFLKCKSALNDDTNSSLDEFDRRLRALNNNRRNQPIKLNNQTLNTTIEKKQQQIKNDLQPTIKVQNDKKDVAQQLVYNEERPKPSRILPSISSIPVTSTPNDTTNELTTSLFRDDESQELSNVQSANTSFIDNQINHIDNQINHMESSIHQQHSLSLEKTETLNSSTLSLNHSLTQTLFAPKARRSDGTELVLSSSKSPIPRASSNILLFNHCYFPRSLTSRGKLNTNSALKRQLPSLPIIPSSEQKQTEQQQQFDANQLYDLLDHLDNDSNQNSNTDFTEILNQLTLSNVIINTQDELNHNSSIENRSLINNDENEEQEENIPPNLFHHSSTSQEKRFYSTLTMNIDDLKNLLLYTMTLSTVQLSASILLPYSILNGRRPLLKCSDQTHFKRIHSKQEKYTYQVTAIESSLYIEQLQQNDVILKINDQSVWDLSTDAIIDILKQSNNCSLTIARLCQPFI